MVWILEKEELKENVNMDVGKCYIIIENQKIKYL